MTVTEDISRLYNGWCYGNSYEKLVSSSQESMSATFFRSAITGICSGAFQGASGVGGSIIMVTALSSKWGLKLPQVEV